MLVPEIPTDTLSEWLDKLGLNDVNSVDDGDILWIRFDLILSGAGR